MADEAGSVGVEVSGGQAQGVIGAGEVSVERLIINNYAAPSAVAEEPTEARAGELPDNPYKGLLHFGPNDADLFFGRQKAIDKLIGAIEAKSFNAILGPSGCGKSSVVLAGVAPALHATGQWTFTYFRISDSLEQDPFLALAQSLLPLYQPELDETDRLMQRRKLGAALRSGELPIADVLDAIRRNHPERRVLLIADQFEELYTSNIDPDVQHRFVDLLIEATHAAPAGAPPPVSLAVTLRADFLGVASLHRPFADAIDESVHILGPMDPEELRQAIVEPARLRGVTFDDGVVDTILADVGREPGNLPLLEFALTQMWDRQTDGHLTLAAYDGVGRVTGALTNHADQILESLDPADQAKARRIFTQLVRLGSGTEDTRRVARHEELGDSIWPLVQRLAGPGCRLVVTNATADEGETAEVMHEALIKHWETLRQWVAEDRVFLTWQDSFRVFLKQWDEQGHSESDLLRGATLSQAEEWRANRPDALTETENAFIDTSIEARDRQAREETERQKRDLRRQRIIAIAAVVVAVVLGGLGLFLNEALTGAKEERIKADAARDDALKTQSRFLAKLSRERTESGEAVTGVLLALRALPQPKSDNPRPYIWQAHDALYRGLFERRELRELAGHEGEIRHAAFNRDGSRIVTASNDRTARIWDARDGALIATLGGHEGEVWHAAFNGDGSRIVTASSDGTARIWDARDGDLIATLAGHEDIVRHAAFNRDGSRVVTASSDNTARIWDARDGALIATLGGHEGEVRHAAFNGDDSRIVTASSDNTARIWDARDGNLIATLADHEGGVSHAAFNGDGSRIVTASDDNTARIWDASDGAWIATLAGHESGVFHAAFNGDGSRIVTASFDNTARIWDAHDGNLIATLADHEGWVTHAAFNGDGSRIVTASFDNTARIWDARDGDLIATLVGHEDVVGHAAFNRDGSRIVTASRDGTARIWDAHDGNLIATLGGHKGQVTLAAFNRDYSRIVTASDDYTARIWDAHAGNLIATLADHEGGVSHAAFNGDGSRVVTASSDNTARIWDARDGNLIATLADHEDRVTHAAFSGDGSRIVTASRDKTARIWDARDGNLIATLADHEGWVTHAAFNGDGSRIVTASDDKTARIWDARDGNLIATLAGHEDRVTHAAFNGDDSRIVTASWDKTARIWDARDGNLIATLADHEGGVSHAAFNGDGSRVVTASWDGTARIWDAHDGNLIAILAGHEGWVSHAAFNGDGSRIVTASSDNTARIWDARDGNLIATLAGHEFEVNHAAFNGDGSRIVTASRDNTARIWTIFLTLEDAIAEAKRVEAEVRSLTPEQEKEFFLTE